MKVACVVCKVKRENPEAECFIVDVTPPDQEKVCDEHCRKLGQEVFLAKDYLALNKWAGNLGKGVHFYKITG